MQQHPVPQNVTGFQFKLIGDMTVKQFVYLAAGTLLAFFITKLDWPSLIKFPLALASFGAGFGFAFMPIEDRPLDRWVTTFLKNIYAPTIFLWRKSSDIPEVLQPMVMAVPRNTSTKIVGGVSQETVSEYLRSLPDTLSPLDEKEQQMLKQVSENINKEYGLVSSTGGQYGETGLVGITNRITQETQNPLLATAVTGSEKVITIRVGNTLKIIPAVGRIKVRPLRKPPVEKESEEEKKKETPVVLEKKTVSTPEKPSIKNNEHLEEKKKEDKIVSEAAQNLTLEKNAPATVHVSFKANTVKPLTSAADKTEQDKGLSEKISQLEQDISQMSGVSAGKKVATDKESSHLKDSLKIIEEKFAQALSEKQKIEDELSKIRSNASAKKPDENVFVPNQMTSEAKKETTTVKFVPSQMAAKVGVPQPTKANIVSGIVKDQTGDFLPNVLIEIKDAKGKTERALKSNKLGQFFIATSLDNGVYTIHFEDPAGLHEFDIIEVTLDGKIFPAMEVTAKNQKDTEREKLREALFGKQN